MNWGIYTAQHKVEPREIERWLATAPPWRRPPANWKEKCLFREARPWRPDEATKAQTYIATGGELENERVNMALFLRRPLLVTGPPGIGKSTLAYNIAWQLGLGPPLRWEINSRTMLQDGLSFYDSVRHFGSTGSAASGASDDPGAFISLGPLGTGLLPTAKPRVVLIDEFDKSSYDLPNDLLHVFEESGFMISELLGDPMARVWPADRQPGEERVPVPAGEVRAVHHPVVVITSNGERDFSAAFKRRCVELTLSPDVEAFHSIVRSWFGDAEGLDAVLAQGELQNVDAVLQALFLTRDPVGADPATVVPALRRTN